MWAKVQRSPLRLPNPSPSVIRNGRVKPIILQGTLLTYKKKTTWLTLARTSTIGFAVLLCSTCRQMTGKMQYLSDRWCGDLLPELGNKEKYHTGLGDVSKEQT